LKEIGRYLGFHWPEGVGSGLESIVWRSRWEVSRDPEEKQRLLDYNRLDCEALERVTGALLKLVRDAPSATCESCHTNDRTRRKQLTAV